MTSRLASIWASPGSPRMLGRYELVAELGRGGMAEVYLARSVGAAGVAKYVAIKRILPHLAREPSFVTMFIDEGRIATRLAHPNLCAVFELGQDGDELFLVMEYLDGLPWATIAQAVEACTGPTRVRIAATVIHQACTGIDHAHRLRDVTGRPAGVVHRDVSPQNLFVTRDGTCKVVDFGISKAVDDPRRTRTGSLKGKPPYMAPEQVRGDTVDARTDVWALGVVLWEAIAGRSLFLRDTDYLIFEAIHDAVVPSLGAIEPAAASLDVVLARALDRRREDRFASAAELADAIAGACPLLSARELAAVVVEHCGELLADRHAMLAAAFAHHRIETETDIDIAIDPPVEAYRREHTYTLVPPRRRPTRSIAAIVAVGVAVIAIMGTGSTGEPSVEPPAEPAAELAAAHPVVSPAAPPRVESSSPPAVAEPPRPASRPPTPPPRRAAPGTLVVDTAGYATVFVDDLPRGDTPLRIPLTPGSHRVRAIRAGHTTTRIVRITTGTTTPLRLTW